MFHKFTSFILLSFLIMTFIKNNYAKEIFYKCSVNKDIQLGIYIDRKNKKIRPAGGDFELYNIKFDEEKVRWAYDFINPVNNKNRTTYAWFYFDTKKFIQNIYPGKNKLSKSDLIKAITLQCS